MLASRRLVHIIAIVFLFSGAHAAAQIPPETSAWELVDLVPPAAPVTCGCVTGAFALPTFRPKPGWGGGPATPAEWPPLTDFERRHNAERRAEETRSLAMNVEHGLAGNSAATFGVATHLREASLAAGGDARMEMEAARWLHLAAAQGHADAFQFLGFRYQRGIGVPQSDEAAAHWFHQGALHGSALSMVALGLRYATGRGVPQDYAVAVHWWRKAGSTALAARFLGDAYACGMGVDQNAERAVRHYTLSQDSSADIQLGRLYISGCAAPDDEKAAKLFRRAADGGDVDAQIALSELFLKGRGVELSAGEAYFWARMAERRLQPGAQRDAARALMTAAARMMSPEHIAGTDRMIDDMIAATLKRDQ